MFDGEMNYGGGYTQVPISFNVNHILTQAIQNGEYKMNALVNCVTV